MIKSFRQGWCSTPLIYFRIIDLGNLCQILIPINPTTSIDFSINISHRHLEPWNSHRGAFNPSTTWRLNRKNNRVCYIEKHQENYYIGNNSPRHHTNYEFELLLTIKIYSFLQELAVEF